MNTNLCSNCKTELNEDSMRWSSVLSGEICEGCFDEDMTYPATIRIVNPNGDVETYLVGDLNIITEYGDDTDLPAKRQWVSTDGWRGYNKTEIDGWVAVLTGWTTGGYDDPIARRKRLFNNFAEYLLTNDIYPPCQVALITDTTSNLFSTAVTVQVLAKDEDTFNNWLNSTEYPAEELSHSLS
jgi:hypothetical protein